MWDVIDVISQSIHAKDGNYWKLW